MKKIFYIIAFFSLLMTVKTHSFDIGIGVGPVGVDVGIGGPGYYDDYYDYGYYDYPEYYYE